jgi:hypothetical protein
LPAAFSRFFDMPMRCQSCTHYFDVPRARTMGLTLPEPDDHFPAGHTTSAHQDITHRNITSAGLPLTGRYPRGETITASPAPIAAGACCLLARAAARTLSG